jgi:putative transposase
MAQSFAKIYIHLIFSTKNRERCISHDVGIELHGYMGGILNGLGCAPIEINAEPDHVHLLFAMTRSETIGNVVGQLKQSSSDWLRNRDPQFRNFEWQAGYGAFSVSQSGVEEVRRYIRGQRQHHKNATFQDEFRAFLKRYEIEFDERHAWD